MSYNIHINFRIDFKFYQQNNGSRVLLQYLLKFQKVSFRTHNIVVQFFYGLEPLLNLIYLH